MRRSKASSDPRTGELLGVRKSAPIAVTVSRKLLTLYEFTAVSGKGFPETTRNQFTDCVMLTDD